MAESATRATKNGPWKDVFSFDIFRSTSAHRAQERRLSSHREIAPASRSAPSLRMTNPLGVLKKNGPLQF